MIFFFDWMAAGKIICYFKTTISFIRVTILCGISWIGRTEKRGNEYEQYLTNEYLTKINEAYSRFFLDYEKAPVLIVNAADINFEENEEDYEMLVTKIMSNPKGKTFINPQPSIL